MGRAVCPSPACQPTGTPGRSPVSKIQRAEGGKDVQDHGVGASAWAGRGRTDTRACREAVRGHVSTAPARRSAPELSETLRWMGRKSPSQRPVSWPVEPWKEADVGPGTRRIYTAAFCPLAGASTRDTWGPSPPGGFPRRCTAGTYLLQVTASDSERAGKRAPVPQVKQGVLPREVRVKSASGPVWVAHVPPARVCGSPDGRSAARVVGAWGDGAAAKSGGCGTETPRPMRDSAVLPGTASAQRGLLGPWTRDPSPARSGRVIQRDSRL